MVEDFERCYPRAAVARSTIRRMVLHRVTSTHIYCRPSCPAQTPMRKNVVSTLAAARSSPGFRACKLPPSSFTGVDSRRTLAARAMRLIARLVDAARSHVSLDGSATACAIGRVCKTEIGAGSRLHSGTKSGADARSSSKRPACHGRRGFARLASVDSSTTPCKPYSRRLPRPFALVRRDGVTSPKRQPRSSLRLAFRQPLCPDNLFGHLAATGFRVEEVRDRPIVGLCDWPTVRIVELTPTPDYINCRGRVERYA